MKSKLLITGASGFIGWALVNKLSQSKEFEVTTVDHEALISHGGEDLRKLMTNLQPDYIFHLSAYGNHSDQSNHNEIFLANVMATYNMVHTSIDIPYKSFINIGSSSEYGAKDISMNELDLPEGSTMYACTKVAGTYLARAFAKKYDKPIITVRPFSVFGPGEKDDRFIPTVCRALLLGEELTLEPSAKHDWIYIDDFVEALGIISDVAIAANDRSNIVNVGTGMEWSNAQIVEMLETISKKKAKIKLVEGLRPNDSKTWRADISKLTKLGWKQKTTLGAGLYKTYQYYKNKYYGN